MRGTPLSGVCAQLHTILFCFFQPDGISATVYAKLRPPPLWSYHFVLTSNKPPTIHIQFWSPPFLFLPVEFFYGFSSSQVCFFKFFLFHFGFCAGTKLEKEMEGLVGSEKASLISCRRQLLLQLNHSWSKKAYRAATKKHRRGKKRWRREGGGRASGCLRSRSHTHT